MVPEQWLHGRKASYLFHVTGVLAFDATYSPFITQRSNPRVFALYAAIFWAEGPAVRIEVAMEMAYLRQICSSL